ncbi:ANTAR domain-containing protein [Streptomyces longwoodensis]|uniref:ANTAR domain-containing protein n=1 Tax=Streptomyces longwoodensis TaxID=68231 RepID=UPI00225ADF67|nr:ANTAR domain-containing protein [Streptomyces longwoodensis]MCX4999990.1 ANTAR domain-containing protein [Streptomyces longwoodensis]
MTTPRVQRSVPETGRDAELARLHRENAQLRQAIASHARVDQAIGVLIATYEVSSAAGFEVLREVSQHTNVKLRTIAEAVIGWALGRKLPQPLAEELEGAVERRQERTGTGWWS